MKVFFEDSNNHSNDSFIDFYDDYYDYHRNAEFNNNFVLSDVLMNDSLPLSHRVRLYSIIGVNPYQHSFWSFCQGFNIDSFDNYISSSLDYENCNIVDLSDVNFYKSLIFKGIGYKEFGDGICYRRWNYTYQQFLRVAYYNESNYRKFSFKFVNDGNLGLWGDWRNYYKVYNIYFQCFSHLYDDSIDFENSFPYNYYNDPQKIGSILSDGSNVFLLNRYSIQGRQCFLAKKVVYGEIVDFWNYWQNGDSNIRDFEINVFGYNFNFFVDSSIWEGEIIELSDCTCDIVTSLDNLTTAINNKLGSIDTDLFTMNGNLSSISNKLTSPNVSISSIPCLDFCQGASIGIDSTLPIDVSIENTSPVEIELASTLVPIPISFPQTDWGNLINALVNLINLFKNDYSVSIKDMPCLEICDMPNTELNVNFPDTIDIGNFPGGFSITSLPNVIARITDLPRQFSISNFPNSFNIGNFPESFDIGNIPGSFAISSIPCINFCEDADLDVNISNQISTIRITDLPRRFEITNFPDSFDIGNFPNSFSITSLPNILARITDMPKNFSITNFPNSINIGNWLDKIKIDGVIHNVVDNMISSLNVTLNNLPNVVISSLPSIDISFIPSLVIRSLPCVELCEDSEITVKGLDGFEITVGDIGNINVDLDKVEKKLEDIEGAINASECQIDLVQYPLEASVFKNEHYIDIERSGRGV